MGGREADWDAVHEALPSGWIVGRPSIADPLAGSWEVSAIAQRHGSGNLASYVIGGGASEVEALHDLSAKLWERPDAGGALEGLRARKRPRLASAAAPAPRSAYALEARAGVTGPT